MVLRRSLPKETGLSRGSNRQRYVRDIVAGTKNRFLPGTGYHRSVAISEKVTYDCSSRDKNTTMVVKQSRGVLVLRNRSRDNGQKWRDTSAGLDQQMSYKSCGGELRARTSQSPVAARRARTSSREIGRNICREETRRAGVEESRCVWNIIAR